MSEPSRVLAVRWPLLAAALATLSGLASIAGFAALLEGYSHASHPIGWLGGRGLPAATAFNLLAYLLPGLLLAAVAWRQREGLPEAAGWAARIGAWLVLLSTLAFAAQGLLPLDLEELDAGDSRGHATAWMLWWIAFLPGVWMLEPGRRRLPQARGWPWRLLLGGVAFPFLALLGPLLVAPGFAQRIALACWFGWWLLCAWALSRGAASSPG